MRKLLLPLMTLFVSGMLFAQTVTIPDFTVTSSTGQQVTFYTELNKGKVIVLDLWYNECGFCQSYAPTIEQIYQAKGAGAGSFDVLSLNVKGQSDASINAYKTAHGVTNKCFGGAEASSAKSKVVTAFYPGGTTYGTPSFVVVCPNKKGWWNVNKPPTLTGFDTYIAQCGSSTGVNNIVQDENQARFVSIYPNPVNSDSKIDFFLAERSKIEITMFNLLGKQVVVLANEIVDAGTHTLDLSVQLPSGNYLVKMIAENGVADVAKLVIAN